MSLSTFPLNYTIVPAHDVYLSSLFLHHLKLEKIKIPTTYSTPNPNASNTCPFSTDASPLPTQSYPATSPSLIKRRPSTLIKNPNGRNGSSFPNRHVPVTSVEVEKAKQERSRSRTKREVEATKPRSVARRSRNVFADIFSLSIFFFSFYNSRVLEHDAKESERGEEKEIERVLAGLREVAARFAATRRRKVRIRVMDWWQKAIFPMRKAWMAVSARVRARKNGGGILKLHDDVQTCGYEDVQVMWEMLRRYETSELPHPPKRKRPFWRIFVWSSNAPSLSRT